MKNWLRTFRDLEDGAITVDWVVLTAAVVGLAVAIGLMVNNAILDPASGIGAVVMSAADLTQVDL